MLMRVRGRTAALIAACAVVGAPTAAAAPRQGFQSNASFAASYAQRGVTAVAATAQRVSCYAPEVFYLASLTPSQGYPDGGTTLCNGAATTGEDIGPYPLQDVKNPPARAKDFSESDLHVDPTNPRHLIGVTKWIVNAEGYNHLAGDRHEPPQPPLRPGLCLVGGRQRRQRTSDLPLVRGRAPKRDAYELVAAAPRPSSGPARRRQRFAPPRCARWNRLARHLEL